MTSLRREIRCVAVALAGLVVVGAHGGADAQDLLQRAKESAHGAFAFRKADAAFAAEFNRRLASFVGSSGPPRTSASR